MHAKIPNFEVGRFGQKPPHAVEALSPISACEVAAHEPMKPLWSPRKLGPLYVCTNCVMCLCTDDSDRPGQPIGVFKEAVLPVPR